MRTKPLILLVDDDDNFLEIFGTKLSAAGFDIILGHGPAQGIELATAQLPDLVLMDIHMPVMTGTDAALAIKQGEITKDLKIAFLTSLKEPWPAIQGDHQKVSKELGMEDFLEKSDDLNVLVQKVEEILSRGMGMMG